MYRWALLEPTPTLPACPTCGGRGWCIECEATGVVTGVPGNDRCPCHGRCATCDGTGTCAPPPRDPVATCPRCRSGDIVRETVEQKLQPDDWWTTYNKETFHCLGCGRRETDSEPTDTYPVFRARWGVALRPGPLRCRKCRSTRIANLTYAMRWRADGFGTRLRCLSCSLFDEDETGELYAAWVNPEYAAEIRRDADEDRRRKVLEETRIETDLAPIVATWPWQPRVRTSPVQRRVAPVPGWLEAVVRSPDDIYSRLDAADAVERDDPARATFVRRQIELERKLPTLTHVEAVAALLDEPVPIAAYSPELAVLARERIIADRGFARGFVEHVTMSAADFVACADEVFERAPIRFLTLTHVGTHASAVAQSPALAQIRALHLPGTLERPRPFRGRLERVWTWSLRETDLATLFASPHLAQLQFLHLEPGVMAPETWAQLARSAPALRWVDGAPPREMNEQRRNPAGPIEAAFGGPIAWLRPASPYVPFWTRARATCAGANIAWT